MELAGTDKLDVLRDMARKQAARTPPTVTHGSTAAAASDDDDEDPAYRAGYVTGLLLMPGLGVALVVFLVVRSRRRSRQQVPWAPGVPPQPYGPWPPGPPPPASPAGDGDWSRPR